MAALVDLKAAAAAAPGDASVHRMLAWSYRTMGLSNEAEGALTRSLELEVHWQGYLSRCGVRTDLRRYKEALGDCEAAHKLIKNEDTYYFTALMRADDGQLGEAILLLKEATKSSYASGRLYGLLADIYRREGQKSEAAAVETEGRKAFPEDPSLKAPPPQE